MGGDFIWEDNDVMRTSETTVSGAWVGVRGWCGYESVWDPGHRCSVRWAKQEAATAAKAAAAMAAAVAAEEEEEAAEVW